MKNTKQQDVQVLSFPSVLGVAQDPVHVRWTFCHLAADHVGTALCCVIENEVKPGAWLYLGMLSNSASSGNLNFHRRRVEFEKNGMWHFWASVSGLDDRTPGHLWRAACVSVWSPGEAKGKCGPQASPVVKCLLASFWPFSPSTSPLDE